MSWCDKIKYCDITKLTQIVFAAETKVADHFIEWVAIQDLTGKRVMKTVTITVNDDKSHIVKLLNLPDPKTGFIFWLDGETSKSWLVMAMQYNRPIVQVIFQGVAKPICHRGPIDAVLLLLPKIQFTAEQQYQLQNRPKYTVDSPKNRETKSSMSILNPEVDDD